MRECVYVYMCDYDDDERVRERTYYSPILPLYIRPSMAHRAKDATTPIITTHQKIHN
jgi:hypothetical protein